MSYYKRLQNGAPKKILLITPTSPNEAGATKWLSTNLGIERLAGYLKAHRHHAETYDTNLFKAIKNGPSLEDKLLADQWDIVGFSVMEETLVEDVSNMMMAKKLCPDALIVAGGHAAQFDFQTLLEKSPARIIVLGEGERPLLGLANGVPLDEISGIVVKNPALPLTEAEFTAATLAIDYEHIPYETYWNYYVDLYKANDTEITAEISQMIHTVRIFTRNYCPMRCKFCSSTNFLNTATGSKTVPVVNIDAKELIALIKRIIKAHPRVETFYFTDDDFCYKRTALEEFCRLAIEADLKVSFIAFARIDDLDKNIIGLMKQAGFRTFNMGFENFQPEILKEYNKNYSVELVKGNLQLLNEHGIRPATTFILCSPDAKLEWVENTTRKVVELSEKGFLSPGVNVCVQPQKGSRFYEEYTEFEAQLMPIPETAYLLKRNHFIKCSDLEVREFQYRFLYRWAHLIDAEAKKAGGHLNSQMQSSMKLQLVLEVVEEIKAERGRSDRFKYSQMSQAEKNELWNILQNYSYGASL